MLSVFRPSRRSSSAVCASVVPTHTDSAIAALSADQDVFMRETPPDSWNTDGNEKHRVEGL
jgi:hypothetical protein